jgi:signal transduction histidine kinase
LRRSLALETAALAIVGVLLAITGHASTPLAIFDIACGLLLVGVGIVASDRAHAPRFTLIWVATGVVWLAGILWPVAAPWHRGPLIHGLLGYPTGRLDSWQSRAVVTAAYLSGVLAPANQVVNLVIALAAAWTAGSTWRHTTGRDHEARRVGIVGVLIYSGVLVLSAVQSRLDWRWDRGVLLAYMATVGAIAAVATADLATGRWTRSAVAGLVIDVGRSGDLGLQDAIRRAVGDPSLLIGFWVPDVHRYVDPTGRPLDVSVTPTRIITEIDRDGEKMALLIHDVVTFADPDLLQGVVAAARLAYDNARLQAAAQVHISELTASRRRLVEAADIQRTDLARELRDSTFGRIDAVHDLLLGAEPVAARSFKARLSALDEEVLLARRELDELARGLRPQALTERGLAGALADLADRTPLLVEVAVGSERLPAPVEAAVYFICTEALTNVVKHAQAKRATVAVEVLFDRVIARITDDGVGGTRLDGAGSGLQGLAERAEALDGTLVLSDGSDGGTVVEVSIPIGSISSGADPNRGSAVFVGT